MRSKVFYCNHKFRVATIVYFAIALQISANFFQLNAQCHIVYISKETRQIPKSDGVATTGVTKIYQGDNCILVAVRNSSAYGMSPRFKGSYFELTKIKGYYDVIPAETYSGLQPISVISQKAHTSTNVKTGQVTSASTDVLLQTNQRGLYIVFVVYVNKKVNSIGAQEYSLDSPTTVVASLKAVANDDDISYSMHIFSKGYEVKQTED